MINSLPDYLNGTCGRKELLDFFPFPVQLVSLFCWRKITSCFCIGIIPLWMDPNSTSKLLSSPDSYSSIRNTWDYQVPPSLSVGFCYRGIYHGVQHIRLHCISFRFPFIATLTRPFRIQQFHLSLPFFSDPAMHISNRKQWIPKYLDSDRASAGIPSRIGNYHPWCLDLFFPFNKGPSTYVWGETSDLDPNAPVWLFIGNERISSKAKTLWVTRKRNYDKVWRVIPISALSRK